MYNYKEKKHPSTRLCDTPGCQEAGEHRAPKDRSDHPDYHWFCLEHAREYNRQWNYFAGMSQKEIEAFQKEAMLGHRPTWNHQMRTRMNERILKDKLRHFMDEAPTPIPSACAFAAPIPPKQRQALQTLDLEHPIAQSAIKTQYKKLVKQYHPDVNQGNRAAEERFKHITEAYRLLVAEYKG